MLLRIVPLAGAAFLFVSISIAVAAVVGRYHYALDVLAGATIAVAVLVLNG